MAGMSNAACGMSGRKEGDIVHEGPVVDISDARCPRNPGDPCTAPVLATIAVGGECDGCGWRFGTWAP